MSHGGACMNDAQALLAALGGICVAVAVFAGWREQRRRSRVNVDAVGVVDWTSVQVAALIALAVLGWVALKA